MKSIFVAFMLIIAIAVPAYAQDKNYAIEEIRDGIYRTQSDRHYGIVLEGKESLLVFDTISEDFSQWLDKKLQKKFDKPVSHVIYSHNHTDHVSGGQVFQKYNPLYIAHDLAKDSMLRMNVDTQIPTLTFNDQMTIHFDDKDVVLQYWGPNDGVGNISLYIPDQKFIAAIDWALTDRVGYLNLSRYDVEGVIKTLEAVEKLDWDLISPGHASIGNKEDVQHYRRYLETIRDNVIKGLNEGLSRAETVEAVMEVLRKDKSFRSLKMFNDWAPLNIEGFYQQIGAKEGAL